MGAHPVTVVTPTGTDRDIFDAAANHPDHRAGSAAEPVRWRLRARWRRFLDRPVWERWAELAGLGVAVGAALFVLFQLQPHLLLRDTTAAGGDTGAHVWWPAYLRDHLLGQGRIAGWSPDFYAGFPAGQFYFPLPALLIVAADVLLPYNVAFKLVTALGPVALPLGAYAFGRGLRVPRPGPSAMAVGSVAFLFFKGDPGTDPASTTAAFNQRIMGGNLASTLAGEFSFTIALALSLAFLGALAWALDRRASLWLPALLLAATVLSHLVVGVFAVAGATVVWLARRPLHNLGRAVAVGLTGALLTAIWTVPLLATLGYTTDMGYEAITDYRTYLLPSYLEVAFALAGVAIVAGVVARRRVTLELVALAGLTALLFRVWEWFSTPAWNLRLLPFWYVMVFLLAGVGVAEIVRGVGWLAARSVSSGWWNAPPPAPPSTEAPSPTDALSPTEADVARPPTPAMVRSTTTTVFAVVVAVAALVWVHNGRAFLDFWARWNYTGYERAGAFVDPTAKSGDELQDLVAALDELPPGRALWEPTAGIGTYGTPLALMLLPYFTDGRIASMEGLYYEASATTPYHFMAVAALSGPGNATFPVRGLPYRTIADFDLGVRWLQHLGTRYFVATSPDAVRAAEAHPDLELVGESPDHDGQSPTGWRIYRVAGSRLVEPIAREPVVVEGVDTGDWSDDIGVPWWDDPEALDRPIVAGGPEAWERADAPGALRKAARRGKALPAVEVTDIATRDDAISFRVSRPGVPVVVKASYFPNWEVTGADGPWRATPNLMVVVPTEREVRLSYGTTTAEWAGRAGTLAGFAALGALPLLPARRPDEDGPDADEDAPDGGEDAPDGGEDARRAADPRPETGPRERERAPTTLRLPPGGR